MLVHNEFFCLTTTRFINVILFFLITTSTIKDNVINKKNNQPLFLTYFQVVYRFWLSSWRVQSTCNSLLFSHEPPLLSSYLPLKPPLATPGNILPIKCGSASIIFFAKAYHGAELRRWILLIMVCCVTLYIFYFWFSGWLLSNVFFYNTDYFCL